MAHGAIVPHREPSQHRRQPHCSFGSTLLLMLYRLGGRHCLHLHPRGCVGLWMPPGNVETLDKACSAAWTSPSRGKAPPCEAPVQGTPACAAPHTTPIALLLAAAPGLVLGSRAAPAEPGQGEAPPPVPWSQHGGAPPARHPGPASPHLLLQLQGSLVAPMAGGQLPHLLTSQRRPVASAPGSHPWPSHPMPAPWHIHSGSLVFAHPSELVSGPAWAWLPISVQTPCSTTPLEARAPSRAGARGPWAGLFSGPAAFLWEAVFAQAAPPSSCHPAWFCRDLLLLQLPDQRCDPGPGPHELPPSSVLKHWGLPQPGPQVSRVPAAWLRSPPALPVRGSWRPQGLWRMKAASWLDPCNVPGLGPRSRPPATCGA